MIWPNPVLLQFGPLQVHWYGLMYLLGFIGAWLFLRSPIVLQKAGLKAKQLDDFLFYLIFGLLIGGRLGYVLFYQPLLYWQKPWEILFLWQGGMSFHGGLLGVTLAAWLFTKKQHLKFLRLSDQIVRIAPLGLMLGRLGNFINGELYGRIATNGWCLNFPTDPQNCRYPTQLWEAATEGLLLLILLNTPALQKIRSGGLSALFLCLYGLFRFIVEFWREPDVQIGYLFGWLTLGQIFCLAMILAGITLYFKSPNANK